MKPSNENISKPIASQGGSSKGFPNNKNMQSSSTSTRGNSVAPAKSNIGSRPIEGPIKANYHIQSQQQVVSNNYLDPRVPRTNQPTAIYQQQVLPKNQISSNSSILRDKTNSSMNNDSYQNRAPSYPFEMGKSENKMSVLQSKNTSLTDNSRRNDNDALLNYKNSIGSDSQSSYMLHSQTPSQIKYSQIPQISPKEGNRDPVARFTVGTDVKFNNATSDYRNIDREKEKPYPPSSSKPVSYTGGNPYFTPTSNTPVQPRENFVSQIQNDIQPKSAYSYSTKATSGLTESSTKQPNYSEISNLLSNQDRQNSNYSYSNKGYSEYEERKSEREKTVQHKIIHSPSKTRI
jgi:hypothetical protein